MCWMRQSQTGCGVWLHMKINREWVTCSETATCPQFISSYVTDKHLLLLCVCVCVINTIDFRYDSLCVQ